MDSLESIELRLSNDITYGLNGEELTVLYLVGPALGGVPPYLRRSTSSTRTVTVVGSSESSILTLSNEPTHAFIEAILIMLGH